MVPIVLGRVACLRDTVSFQAQLPSNVRSGILDKVSGAKLAKFRSLLHSFLFEWCQVGQI